MDDRARVADLLGRPPRGDFEVVVRDRTGDPIVVRNAPFLTDGTPMPTRYYLVGSELVRAVSRLEADGGVRRAEQVLDPDTVAATHGSRAAASAAPAPASSASTRTSPTSWRPATTRSAPGRSGSSPAPSPTGWSGWRAPPGTPMRRADRRRPVAGGSADDRR
jgi:hypothetical protein